MSVENCPSEEPGIRKGQPKRVLLKTPQWRTWDGLAVKVTEGSVDSSWELKKVSEDEFAHMEVDPKLYLKNGLKIEGRLILKHMVGKKVSLL